MAEKNAAEYTVPGLSLSTGRRTAEILQGRLHALNDLQLTLKHAHWNVVGPGFIGVHEMLDPQIELVRGMVDVVAERIATLGVSPAGTPGALVAARAWDDYTLGRASTLEHLAALDLVYDGVVTDHRAAIDATEDLDPVTQDILIDQVAQLELFQWFMRSFLTDADGTEYVDLVGSWGPMILGHTHPEVLDAVTSAAARGFSFGTPNPHEVELAEEIVRRIEPVEAVRLVNSGTEATMSALRLARGFTGREKVVKFAGNYHGHVDALLAQAGSGVVTFALPDSAGVPASSAGQTLVLPYNDVTALEQAFAELPLPRPFYFSSVTESQEDKGTVDYLMDIALQSGLDSRYIQLEQIGDIDGQLVDLEGYPIQGLFKLYPWEFMLQEDFASVILSSQTQWLEPGWKMLLSNKGILPLLWQQLLLVKMV